MLELRHLSKHFSGIPAVDDVNFCAQPGEVTGYLGPNGSGKSTTMKMITGLIKRTSGTILFEAATLQTTPSPTSGAWAMCLRSRISTTIFPATSI